MKLKVGVKIEGLKMEIIMILPIVNDIIRWTGEEMVITSGLEGLHMQGSLHYVGRAIDIRLPFKENNKNEWVVSVIQVALGKDFDVILENDHIHIEFDPE